MATSMIQANDTGWINSQSSQGSIYYRRKDGVLYIRNKSSFTISSGIYNTLFTLPQEYRPSSDIYKVVGGMGSGSLYTVRIKQSDGTVAIAEHLGTSQVWDFDISFVLN